MLTEKRMKQLAVAGLALSAALFVEPSVAGAGGDIQILHVEPAAGVEDVDLILPVATESGCGLIFCSDIELTLTYVLPDGTKKWKTQTVPRLPSPQATTFTIPGAHLEAPAVNYWFTASQTYCTLFGRCTTYTGRSPSTGSHEVIIAPEVVD